MDYKEKIKKFLGQIKNTKLLVIIFILGIVLMLFPTGNGEKDKEVILGEESGTEYKQNIEKELEKALSLVKGAGNVKVLVNLENDGESFMAKDEKNEKDENSQGYEESYVLKNDNGGGQSPVVLKKNTPKISGVLVVAEGAGNENIKNELTLAVRAVLGVKPHRVYVLCKK